ncbi:hypothetical protein BDV93DRAFT_528465 [Ceratobasidium sp. AG-I]|nr:hypothetical protein BDV93DRAFT_528465 [Ceratobasidium sp. AG-I]
MDVKYVSPRICEYFGFHLTIGSIPQDAKTISVDFAIPSYRHEQQYLHLYPSLNPYFFNGSLLFDNIKLTILTSGVVDKSSKVYLGGDTIVRHWAQGNVYARVGTMGRYFRATTGSHARLSPGGIAGKDFSNLACRVLAMTLLVCLII